MKLTAILLFYLLCPLIVKGDLMKYFAANPNFAQFYQALTACSSCAPFTNPDGGILVYEKGALLSPSNMDQGIYPMDQEKLGSWFFGEATFPRGPVPSINDLTNDQTLLNYFGNRVLFNVYGGTRTANGIPVIEEIRVGGTQRVWRVSSKKFIVLFVLLGTNHNNKFSFKKKKGSVVPPLRQTNLYVSLSSDTDFSSFVNVLVSHPTLIDRLSNDNITSTVFVPTSEAFSSLAQTLHGRLDLFFSMVKAPVRQRLERILSYHCLDTTYWRYGLEPKTYTTLSGSTLGISLPSITDNQGNDVTVMNFDISGINGVIHKINKVLLPEALPTFSSTLDDWNFWNQSVTSDNLKTVIQATGFHDLYLTSSANNKQYTFIAGLYAPSTLDLQLNHLIEGIYFSNSLQNDMVVQSVGGGYLRFNLYESWYVNGRPFNNDYMDWVTINGAMHVYSGSQSIPFFTDVLWTKIPEGGFKNALRAAGLETALSNPEGSYTLLYPNAWTEGNEDLVKYHVLTNVLFKPHPGMFTTLQGSQVNVTASGLFDGIPVMSWAVTLQGARNGMILTLQGTLPQPPIVEITTTGTGSNNNGTLSTTSFSSIPTTTSSSNNNDTLHTTSFKDDDGGDEPFRPVSSAFSLSFPLLIFIFSISSIFLFF